MLSAYQYDNPMSLSLDEAQAVMAYKRRSTYRALAVRFLGFECQISGRDLARDAACRILGLDLDGLYAIELGADPDFDAAHAGLGGGGYWWE